MVTNRRQEYISPEEYLEGEKISEIKHEYIDGEVYAMAGASDAHINISGNLYIRLRNHLRGGGCSVYISDMKAQVHKIVELEIPEVYRLYCIDTEIFGFNARRFKDKNIKSPWVSHAQGAVYVYDESPDIKAQEVAKMAFISTDLYYSFGAVDLLKDKQGKWYALEVGTDGIYNYVDRDVENEILYDEINERLAKAFWKKIGITPWGRTWKYRN